MAYEEEVSETLRLAATAGALIRQYYIEGIDHKMKENNTPVTQADLESNKILLEGLIKAFPGDGIVSEELQEVKGKREGIGSRVWYLDPLDGTKSFVQRGDTFGIHIGLAISGSPVFGVVHKPLTGESYLGMVGRGAWRVLPSGKYKPLDIAGELPGLIPVVEKKRSDYENNKQLFDRLGITGCMFSGSEGIRVTKILDNLAHFRIGSLAANAWDTCAPQAILEAAHGYVGYPFLDKPVSYVPGRSMEGVLLYARNKQVFDVVKSEMRRLEEEKYDFPDH